MNTHRSTFRKALVQVTSVAVLAAIVACGGSGNGDDSDPLDISASPTESGGDEALAIEALNLHIDAPAGARVSELLGSQMISGGGLTVSVDEADGTDAETLEQARDRADIFNPTNLSDETLDDGWILTYENTGGMGTNYFVNARRTIDGTSYMCDGTLSSAEQQQRAVEACRSLRR